MVRMTYAEALQYLYSFADFERTGAFARDAEGNLRRMRDLLTSLGNPDQFYQTTHIAGTKGKGSTASLIAAALTASGIPTGLYAQPDLHTFRERIQFDSVPISADQVAALVPEVAMAEAAQSPADRAQTITYELGTALALLAFARARVGHAVVEVGLGGRLDATNVIQPLVGVITSISLDHMAILGATIAAIAGQKAGIIKPGMALVTSARHPDALEVIAVTCAARGVPLTRVGPWESAAEYGYPPASPRRVTDPSDLSPPPFLVRTPLGERSIQIGLLGAHQRENATAALAALDLLQTRGVPVTASGIAVGMLAARWPGRLEVVGARPWVVIDGAHNVDSMARALEAVADELAYDRLVIVYGVMRDKDAAGICATIATQGARLKTLVMTQIAMGRALPATELAELGTAALATAATQATCVAVPEPGAAFADAIASAGPDDLVLVAGSLYLAGAALRWCHAHLTDPLAQRIVIAGDDHS